MRETARNVAHNRSPKDNDKMVYDFFGGCVQNTISRGVRAAEEQLRRIEADPKPKTPKLMQVRSYFNVEPLQSEVVIKAAHLTQDSVQKCHLAPLNFPLSHCPPH